MWWASRACAGALGVALFLGVTACQGESPRPVSTEAFCIAASTAALSLYDPGRSQTAEGFGGISSLDAAPSVYYTGWSLRLANEIGKSLPPERSSITSALKQILADDRPSSEGLSSLDQVRLASISLGLLGSAESTSGAFEAFQVGAGYEAEKGEGATLASTYVAVDGLTAAHGTVPAAVVSDLLSHVASYSGTESLELIVNEGAPALAAAALATEPARVLEAAPGIAAVISSWSAKTVDAGPGATQAVVLGMLASTSVALDLPWSPPAIGFFDPLLVGNSGYYSLDGVSGMDPQLTYFVGLAGTPLNIAEIATGLRKGQGASGWVGTIASAEIGSTFAASTVLAACGVPVPAASVLMDRTADSILSGDVNDPGELFRFLAISQMTSLDIPDDVMRAIQSTLRPTFDAAVTADDASTASMAILAADLSGMAVDSWPLNLLTGLSIPDIRVARSLAEIGRIMGQPDVQARGESALTALSVDGVFSYNTSRLGQTDLYSEAFGRGPGGMGHSDGTDNLKAFSEGELYSLEPRTSNPSSPVTLSSEALAIALLGTPVPYTYLLFL